MLSIFFKKYIVRHTWHFISVETKGFELVFATLD
jgi:hypothetical protein